ncbi:tRNA (adenine-n -)-methyltransferase non-catalytic subunit [Colletotrichum sp. SAR 10_99]|nr:tRNA (adenine-n -)-methyltransferase non-catalytic subunit [Colletotrichum sp. SAR 10_99]
MKSMKVAIIGAGASGLVTAKYLSQAKQYFGVPEIEIRIFEREKSIGGAYRHKVYEDAEMVSSKYLTAFSDFRVAKELPDFLSMEEYVRYLEAYCTKFGLWDLIETQTEIVQVLRLTQRSHRVFYTRHVDKRPGGDDEARPEELSWDCDAVAICSGLNNIPSIPAIKGLENVSSVLHSSEVKSRRQFGENTSVMILGAGETAMDLAHLAVTSTAREVVMCHKEGFYCAKKIEGDRNNADSLFLVKSDRALPYLNEGHRATDLFSRIRAFVMNVELKDTAGRKIMTAPWPISFTKSGTAIFPRSETLDQKEATSKVLRPDLLVLATGYVRRFDFLGEGYPKPDDLNIRGIWRRGDVTAGFIGFVRPGIGAIPPLAELQAQLWVFNLLRHKYSQQIPSPSEYADSVAHYEIDYALKARGGHDLFKTKHGVEQESYAYQLALDMGAAPTFTFMRRQGSKAFLTWAMGSNFNSKFRLVGPWKWEKGALDIMRGELFDVAKQTGGGMFFTTYTLFPIIVLGVLTIVLHMIAGVLRLMGMEERAKVVLGSGNVPRREGDD